MSCGVGCRRSSDPELLCLRHRPVATAPIGPLAWEPPYAVGAAQEIATTTTTKRQKDKKKKKKGSNWNSGHSSAETNPTSIHEDASSNPGLAQWVGDLVLLGAVE